MSAFYKLYAPKCALPGCCNLVSYHNKKGPNYKWKMFCNSHRTIQKSEVDQWKLNQGCSNVNAHHGFLCTSHITDASQLDINHIDGNRHNQDAENLEILCKICHMRVTLESGHHTTRYDYQTYLNPELFEVV